MSDLRSDLRTLSWRGPVMPVDPDGPEALMPRKGGTHFVRVFDLDKQDDREFYERVLNRISRGVAESMDTSLAHTPDGGFRVLLVWRELYMCAPDYVPAESRRVLLSSKGAEPVVDFGGADDPPDDDENLQSVMREWLGTPDAEEEDAPEGEDPPADPEPAQAPLVYGESADAINIPEN